MRVAITYAIILGFIMLLCPGQAWARAEAPAPVASYTISVSLDAEKKQLNGHEQVTYVNQTRTPFSDVVFHLYLNAFRDEKSLFFRESGGYARGFVFDPAKNGWIEATNLRITDGETLELIPIEDGTLARAELPQPVLPGEQIQLELDFTAQLPGIFARTGWAEDARGDPFFMVGQWFPKLGVWQEGGWNAYPYHANAEFFADFGAYDVAIMLPSQYQTGGTGMPSAPEDNGDGTQTISYHAENVIDFAWTASPNLRTATRNGAGIDVVYLYLPEHTWTVRRVLDAAEAALTHYSTWFGAYPYPRLTVVDVPDSGEGAGGMEYPTLFTAGTTSLFGLKGSLIRLGAERTLEITVIHEAGHQWFQSMVATNEAEEPWLDEGLTDYATMRLADHLYGEGGKLFKMGAWEMDYVEMRRMDYLTGPQVPMYGKAWDFTTKDYGVAAYAKPALALLSLEQILGEETMLRVMSSYFQRYQYGHPATQDFRQVVKEVTGSELSWFFDGLVYGDGVLNYTVSALDDHSVTIERQGELIVPTEVQVTFASGETIRQTWDGQGTPLILEFPDKPAIQKAEVDPDHRLLVDLRWSDNALRRRPDLWSWLALASRLLYQFQNVMLMGGGL